MKATVNGTQTDVRDGATIADLLAQIGVQSTGIAVARNDRVVVRSTYARERIAEGDRIEIIKAVAGG